MVRRGGRRTFSPFFFAGGYRIPTWVGMVVRSNRVALRRRELVSVANNRITPTSHLGEEVNEPTLLFFFAGGYRIPTWVGMVVRSNRVALRRRELVSVANNRITPTSHLGEEVNEPTLLFFFRRWLSHPDVGRDGRPFEPSGAKAPRARERSEQSDHPDQLFRRGG
jgi:hypothetical protein